MKYAVSMRQWIVTGLICLFCSGNFAWAGIELKLPDNMTVVAVNGKNTDINGMINLPDGVNQVAIQFQGLIGGGHSDDDSEMEYSDVFVIKFKARNQSLKMVTPHIKSAVDLDRFNRESDIRIQNSEGNPIDRHIAKLEKDGIQIFRDYENELKRFNKTDAPAALKPPLSVSKGSETVLTDKPDTSKTISSATAGGKKLDSVPQSPSGNMAEKMLKYWYQQADEATRERFRRWIDQ